MIRDPLTERLCFAESTAAELAVALDLPAEKVRRHLRQLTRSGLVERSRRERPHGVTEFHYRFDRRSAILSAAERSAVPVQELEEVQPRLLRKMLDEAVRSHESGRYSVRPETAVIRFTPAVDEAALHEAVRIHDDLLQEIIDIAVVSERRVPGGGDQAIDASAQLILLPSPVACWPRSMGGVGGGLPPVTRVSMRGPVEEITTLSDPVRTKIIESLALGPASAHEIATRLGLSPERCRGELRRLHDRGWVRVHERRQRRGTSEYFYLPQFRKMAIYADEIAGYQGDRLEAWQRECVAWVFRDALEALRSGPLRPGGDGRHISRVPMRLDAVGFGEVSNAMVRAMDRLFRLNEEQARLSANGQPRSLVATSAMLLFERAPA